MNEFKLGKHSLSDEVIKNILMHREAHFSGNFNLMLDYYKMGKKGVSFEFSLEDIEGLKKIEVKLEQNLAALLLDDLDQETIDQAKASYQRLRDLYMSQDHTDKYPQLIADLILSEEAEPKKEIEAIVKEGKAIVPALVELSSSEEFKNPLYPGYGHAPLLAMQCLGEIGNERAIIALFEQIGRAGVFDEESALHALKSIGAPAKKFLLQVLQSKPITEDNERAAIALIPFKEDSEVASCVFRLLQDDTIRKTLSLASYLVLACEGLVDEGERAQFCQLATHPKTPTILNMDFATVIKAWRL